MMQRDGAKLGVGLNTQQILDAMSDTMHAIFASLQSGVLSEGEKNEAANLLAALHGAFHYFFLLVKCKPAHDQIFEDKVFKTEFASFLEERYGISFTRCDTIGEVAAHMNTNVN